MAAVSAPAVEIGGLLEAGTPGASVARVDLGSLECGIDSSDVGALSFLREFLPVCGSPFTERRSFAIACRYDDEMLAALAALLESPAVVKRSLGTFKSVPTVEWTLGSLTVYRQLVGEPHFVIDAGATKVAVAPRDCRNQWHAMRIVREIYLREMLLDDHTMFHGAAVEIGASGLLVVGGKGAGKTTVSSRLMCDGWGFITNDRVLVGWSRGGATAYPYPLDVRVHSGIVGRLVAERLAGMELIREQDAHDHVDKAVDSVPRKHRLSVREWIEAHGAPSRPWAHIAGVLLPHWVGSQDTVGLRRLAPADAVRRLRLHAFLGAGNFFSDEAFGRHPGVQGWPGAGPALPDSWLHKPGPTLLQVQRAAMMACQRLGAELPVYELRIGPRVMTDEGDFLAARLAEIVRAGAVGE